MRSFIRAQGILRASSTFSNSIRRRTVCSVTNYVKEIPKPLKYISDASSLIVADSKQQKHVDEINQLLQLKTHACGLDPKIALIHDWRGFFPNHPRVKTELETVTNDLFSEWEMDKRKGSLLITYFH